MELSEHQKLDKILGAFLSKRTRTFTKDSLRDELEWYSVEFHIDALLSTLVEDGYLKPSEFIVENEEEHTRYTDTLYTLTTKGRLFKGYGKSISKNPKLEKFWGHFWKHFVEGSATVGVVFAIIASISTCKDKAAIQKLQADHDSLKKELTILSKSISSKPSVSGRK
jgi:hypothetical protein